MEKNYFSDDFEHFLKEKTELHKMFPSENVWKKIYRHLHVYRKWTRVGLSALLLGATVLGGKFLLKDTDALLVDNKNVADNSNAGSASQKTDNLNNNLEFNRAGISGGSFMALVSNKLNKIGKSSNKTPVMKSSHLGIDFENGSSKENKVVNPLIIAINNLKEKSIAPEPSLLGAIDSEYMAEADKQKLGQKSSSIENTDALSTSLVIAFIHPKVKESGNVIERVKATVPDVNSDLKNDSNGVGAINQLSTATAYSDTVGNVHDQPLQSILPKANSLADKIVTKLENNSSKLVENNPPLVGNTKSLSEIDKQRLAAYAAEKNNALRKKYAVQFHISPMVSYRKLVDWNNNVNLNSSPRVLTKTNPSISEQYVNHKPTLGFEAGSNILLNLFPGVTLKTGLQLNLSGYQIEAFSGPKETGIYALNTGKLSRPDTIFQPSRLRNYTGYLGSQLQNHYLHLNLPIGLEWRVAGNERLSFNIAAALQPNYLLTNRSYLLSTDYKNYSDELDLIRKWNLNSNFEAYFSFEKHGLRWQLGPQFRYQLLSSFTDKYPIREFLIDYGFKIGVSKILRK